MQTSHRYPTPVTLLHTPERWLPVGHSALKHGCSALSPSADQKPASTGRHVRSAVAVHGVASYSAAPQFVQSPHRLLALPVVNVPLSHV